MTRMCSYAKISKGGAWSADERYWQHNSVRGAATGKSKLFSFFLFSGGTSSEQMLRSHVVPLKLVAYC